MSPHAASNTSVPPKLEEVYDLNVPFKANGLKKTRPKTKYPQYMPTWDKIWFPPLPTFEYFDPALRADTRKPNLLQPGVKLSNITPKMGTELTNIQLSQLTDAGKDELALLVSERKAVVLRDQDFADWGPENQTKFAKHFGKLDYQPVTGTVPGYPGFHIIYRDDNKEQIEKFFEQKSTANIWHHDVSFQHQPPGYVILCILECPETGGDTVLANMSEAYRRLSPGFQEMLGRLRAFHSSERLSSFARANGGIIRKDSVTSLHPIVRQHPVTGEKAIFINDEWITGIEGWKPNETEWLIKYLMDHVAKGHDFQVRLNWKPRTVVIFDNRTVCHTATLDYDGDYEGARHMFRLATLAEEPIPVDK